MSTPSPSLQPQPGSDPELVPPGDRTAAITRLLPAGAEQREATQFESFAMENQIPLDWLWTLRDAKGQPETCVLAVPSPGRTAMLFASEVDDLERVDRLSQLLRHCIEFIRDQSIDLAQALLNTNDLHGLKAYEAASFGQLATLQYMEGTVPRRVKPPGVPDDIQLMPYEDGLQAELIQALDASYENTLDCPGLRGLRRTDDVIKGHQATGQYNPALWTIAMKGGRPAGAILLNRSSKGHHAELVYIGVAAPNRGQGLGSLLLRHGLYLASRARLQHLTLAVDLGNTPALELYGSVGFIGTSKRRAVIRSTPRMQEGQPELGCPPNRPTQVDNACG